MQITIAIKLIVIFVATLLCDTVKLMKQKKVKARMTPSKSWTTLRRKRDEKSLSSPREGSNALKTVLFKMVHTYMVKLMKQKKVKMRMTRNKSRWALRRTRDEKRLEFIFSKKKAECTKNRFLTLHYANNDRHKRALLSVKVHLFV
ncbi:hypothetical protein T4B_10588 [Trichinella pseudospiralis]|uniref:Uncharacterized protein n=3 Tax=Trichinella pseudospiralis TaxID=6337 RepID=A0A0V1IF66_TRIPS|nr:hypothetical protein T4B_10588 [Trichinella pseudospiralis]